jgi:hypothetical protein
VNEGFVEVNDVNAFLLFEDVRRHCWVPLALKVTKMYTGVE